MTEADSARCAVLKLANEHGKFAIPLGARLPRAHQVALEEMQILGWVQLIDFSPIASGDVPAVYRIFLATSEAMTWYRARQ
jgi:hypothetical protein